MKLKKIPVLALFGMGVVASQAYAGTGPVTTGTIEIDGTVTASTATIAGSGALREQLPVLTTLNNPVGIPVARVPIMIPISNCQPGQHVGAQFLSESPDADVATGNQLKNEGTAGGVEVGLYYGADGGAGPVAWNHSTYTQTADASGNAALEYQVAYVPTQNTQTAGTVVSKVAFQLTYQ